MTQLIATASLGGPIRIFSPDIRSTNFRTHDITLSYPCRIANMKPIFEKKAGIPHFYFFSPDFKPKRILPCPRLVDFGVGRSGKKVIQKQTDKSLSQTKGLSTDGMWREPLECKIILSQ